jgi:hypothetical protein
MSKRIIQMSNSGSFSYKPLNLKGGLFYDNMVVFDTIADGSCFFHAILMSFFEPYQLNTIDRYTFVKELRTDLSKKLDSPIDSNDPNSLTYYDKLSKGTLKEFAKAVPKYSLDNMKAHLNSYSYVGNQYLEFISDMFDCDIYILDVEKQNIYMTGDDYTILYKDRKSVVLGYKNNHYELIGVQSSNGHIRVRFEHDDPFIRNIKKVIQSNLKL